MPINNNSVFNVMSVCRSLLKSNLSRLKCCSSSQHTPNISLSSFQSSSLALCVFVCRLLCQRSCLYKATESWIIDAGCSSQHALSLQPSYTSLSLSLSPPHSSSPASPPVVVIVVVAGVNNHQKQKHKSQTRPEKQKERKWGGERQRDGRADWSEAMW